MLRAFQEIKHPSGLTVIFEPSQWFQTLSINCWFQVGSLDEKKGQHGHAHFLEHMLFTASAEKNNVEMIRSLQEVGGYTNAFTTFDHTGYECVVPIEYAQKGFEWAQQVLLEPVFDQDQIIKEKKVILSEYTDGQDQPEIVFEEKFWHQVYQGKTLGLPILGLPEDIEAVSAESLRQFYDQHYHPANMVLSICGNLTQAQVIEFLQQYVYPYLAQTSQGKNLVEACRFTETKFTYQLGRQQRKLEYLFSAVPTLHKDVMALELLSACIGGGEYSYLFQHLRQHKQWVSHAHAYLFMTRAGGHLGIDLVPLAGHVQDVQTEMQSILQGCSWLSDEMIDWAKKDIEKEVLYSLDSCWGRSKLNVYFGLIFGDVYRQEIYYKDLQQITQADLKRVYQQYLQQPFALGQWKAKEDQ